LTSISTSFLAFSSFLGVLFAMVYYVFQIKNFDALQALIGVIIYIDISSRLKDLKGSSGAIATSRVFLKGKIWENPARIFCLSPVQRPEPSRARMQCGAKQVSNSPY